MELFVLDQNFRSLRIIDTYTSFIWNEKYYEAGDFELVMPMNLEVMKDVVIDNYLYCTEATAGYLMIIEDISITSDFEDGDKAVVVGRSLESILDRRVVWGEKVVSGSIHNAINSLVNESFVSPSDANRRVSNFVVKASSDSRVTSLNYDETTEYVGETLYDIIESICQDKKMGFRVRLTTDLKFEFQLYFGEDHSYDQTALPYVVFSPEFENIGDINYREATKDWKNVILVSGDKDDNDRTIFSSAGSGSGLARRECYESSNVSRTVGTGEDQYTYPLSTYRNMLAQDGNKKLLEHKKDKSFDAEMAPIPMWTFNHDYFMGDIVQTADGYGHRSRSLVTSMVINYNESESSKYPTFTILEDDDK